MYMAAWMDKIWQMLETARYALWQRRVAVPGYWDGALGTAERCALWALVLFAGILFVRLCVMLLTRPRAPRRILLFAAVFGVVLGVGVWSFMPRPLTGGEPVEAVSLTRIAQDGETDIPLMLSEQKALTALLETAQCSPGLMAKLPQDSGKSYRLTYRTQSGEAFVWVSQAGTVCGTGAENGMLFSVLSDAALYDALPAV